MDNLALMEPMVLAVAGEAAAAHRAMWWLFQPFHLLFLMKSTRMVPGPAAVEEAKEGKAAPAVRVVREEAVRLEYLYGTMVRGA
jgi:hypothetical protein